MVKQHPTLIAFLGLAFSHLALAEAHSPHAHVHGNAKLDVAVDGGTLTLLLESPLDSLLGFEHIASNDKEKAAVKSMAMRLHKASELFVLPLAAQCRSTSVRLNSPVLEPKLKNPADVHADLDGEFVFKCERPRHLRGLTLQLFKAFPHMREVDVQIATARGQGAVKLTPENNQLKW